MTLISLISGDLLSTILTVIGIVFGVVGVVSETKKEGKLTFGGRLVISGIIIIGILTLIKAEADKKKSATEKQEAINEKVKNLLRENEHYKTTLDKIDSTLKRTDTINKRSDSLNRREMFLLDEQKAVLGRQNEIEANMIRSFNPIQPFQVSIELLFKITPDFINTKGHPAFFETCLAFDRAFVRRYGGAVNLRENILTYLGLGYSVASSPKRDFVPPNTDNIKDVIVDPKCPICKKMPVDGLQFFLYLQENKKKDTTVHYAMAYQVGKGLPTDSISYFVEYNRFTDLYTIRFSLSNLRVVDADGMVKSSLDFKKYAAYCMLFIQEMPSMVRFNEIQIAFPPDYSQLMRADLNSNCKNYCYRDGLPSISVLTHFAK